MAALTVNAIEVITLLCVSTFSRVFVWSIFCGFSRAFLLWGIIAHILPSVPAVGVAPLMSQITAQTRSHVYTSACFAHSRSSNDGHGVPPARVPWPRLPGLPLQNGAKRSFLKLLIQPVIHLLLKAIRKLHLIAPLMKFRLNARTLAVLLQVRTLTSCFREFERQNSGSALHVRTLTSCL